MGWDIGVYEYLSGVENFFYDGHNWHGIQPWHVFAWTKHRQVYPDVRVIEYGSPKRRLKFVLIDCETREEGDTIRFTRGRWKSAAPVFFGSVANASD
jgi:hypothetical protein